MLNKDIFLVNPSERKIINEGVASVNDQKLNVLRYEIETFVCDGQYKEGLEDILDVYLRNLRQEQQPAVWVSGFYGSGKSHLVKMLSSFWVNTKFQDGATARELASLPDSIRAFLIELSTQGKRMGGLHAASGTLGARARGSVRLALLSIIFKSVNLPERYPIARFIMWLKAEGILDEVKNRVEEKGYNWNEEIDNFYVAEGLHETLSEIKPKVFPSPESCVETLNNMYRDVTDVSNDEMVKAIKDALSKDGQLPLTLVVLDEVQQYIAEDSQRAHDVQEAVEACCKHIGSKLLFIGTGQTAVTGTPNLKKLEGRFTLRIELSDTDVEAVVRKVVLAKRPNSVESIRQVMENNLGEISRHLNTTSIGHQQKDIEYFTQDYPILPVRRRFWENALRVLDPTGTDSQLRNQLTMIHKAIQTNLSEELGNIIPADYLYFDLVDKLLQARILPRKVHEMTMSWITEGENEKLLARACGLVFLINKLSGRNHEIGIRATVDVIADLMVTDLTAGSSFLRSKLPGLLDNCELLMKVNDEYKIQTEENIAWLDEFANQKNILANENHRIVSEREDRIKKMFSELVGKIPISHGNSKVTREVIPTFDSSLPSDAEERIYVWVRNGWNVEESSVLVDAKQAGHHSPTVYVFIPKRSVDEIRHYLIEYKAAFATLERKGSPNSPEGQEARAAMTTIFETAKARVNELLTECLSGAKVFQAGGNEVVDSSLKESINEAAKNSLNRLYNQFDLADHPGWGKVYTKAKDGAPDALKYIDYNGEPANNPVCKNIIAYIAGGKKGAEIRNKFEGPGYGWPGDAVDGAIQILLVSGLLICTDEQGRDIDSKRLERKQIGKLTFKIESITVSVIQKIAIRKLFQLVGVKAEPGKEGLRVSEFLETMLNLASNAGGEPPKPAKPDITLLNEIKFKNGNEQLLFIFQNKDILTNFIEQWTSLKEKINVNISTWSKLKELLNVSGDAQEIIDISTQVVAIENNRLLLQEPDVVTPLLRSLENKLRSFINDNYHEYENTYNQLADGLFTNPIWQKLTEDKRFQILQECNIVKLLPPSTGSYTDLLATVRKYPLNSWSDKKYALKAMFDQALEIANKELEPKTQTIDLPKRMFKDEAEIESWLNEVGNHLKASLKNGPIVIR